MSVGSLFGRFDTSGETSKLGVDVGTLFGGGT
jgi:hypothetical protein